jgi:hypothetical protein
MIDNNLNEDTFGKPKSSSASNESFLDKVSKRASTNLQEGRLGTGEPEPLFKQYEPTPFSTYETNYFRYARRSNFDELGFSPYRDNDSLYNAESNFFGETWRGLQGAALTAFNTGLDGWAETANILAGNYSSVSDWWNSYDEGAAEAFGDVNRIYGSTKGGATGFLANGILNTGFVGGMILGSLPELAVETVLTLESGGSGALAGLARAGLKTAKGFKRGAAAIDDVADVAKASRKAQSAIINNARDRQTVSNLSKALNSSLGDSYFTLTNNAIARALNPFSNTGTWVNEALQAKKTGKAVDLTRGVGAVMEDLTVLKGAKLEASMEAGFAASSIRNEYFNKFVEENGRAPGPEELKEIEQLAALKASESIMINMPVIMYTDKLLFNPLFRAGRRLAKSSGFGPTKGINLPKGVDFEADKGFSVGGPDLTGMSTKQALVAKSRYALKGLTKVKSWSNATKAVIGSGLGEGVQEGVQETTSAYLDKKYQDILENPMHLPLQSNASYIADAAKELFVEGTEGWHAVASGMFVGGLFGAGGGKMTKLMNLATKENREAYLENEKRRSEYLNEITDILNDAYKDPYQMLNEQVRTFKEINELNKEYQQIRTLESFGVSDENIAKRKKEIADQMLFTKLTTALSTGTFDIFKQRLVEMQSLDDVSLQEATGEEDVNQVRKNIDEYIQRAEDIKARYESVSKKYPNPFDYSEMSITDPEFGRVRASYDSYEQAKRQLIFLSDEVDKIKGLRQEYENKLRESSIGKNWGAEDTTSVMSLESADREIALLEEEVLGEAGATTPEEKKIFKSKQKKLSALILYRKEFDKYLKTLESLEKESDLDLNNLDSDVYKKKVEAAEKLKAKLENYVKASDAANVALGAEATNFDELQNSLDDFLETIIDFNLANKDLSAAVDLLNILDNPQALTALAKREQAAKEDVFANRKRHIKNSVEIFLKSVEKNEVLHDLKKLGVAIDFQQLYTFLNDGIIPTKLYDLENFNELSVNSDSYKKAMEIIEPYANAILSRKAKEEAEQAKAEAKPSTAEADLLGQLSNTPVLEPTPGVDNNRPNTGNSNPQGTEAVIQNYLNPGEDYIQFYKRLAKEFPGLLDSLAINYIQSASLPYTNVTEMLSDPSQGPKLLALLASIVEAYKQAAVSVPITEWVATSAAAQSSIINNAVSAVFRDGSLNIDQVLELFSNVTAVGDITANVTKDESVITEEKDFQSILADVEGADVQLFMSRLEELGLYLTGKPVEITDPNDARLTVAVAGWMIKDSRGILNKAVHGDREYFTSITSLYNTLMAVFDGIKSSKQSKQAGQKLYTFKGLPGVISSVGTIHQTSDGTYVKITGFGDVIETQGSAPEAGSVTYQRVNKDGTPADNSKPMTISAQGFFKTYSSINNILKGSAYAGLPKLDISNVNGFSYRELTQDVLEELVEAINKKGNGVFDDLILKVKDNENATDKLRDWKASERTNPLIKIKSERATVEVYFKTADNREVLVGFLNDPETYLFQDIDGKQGSFTDPNVQLVEGVHYQLNSRTGSVTKEQLEEVYNNQNRLYTYLASKVGSTFKLSDIQSQLNVELNLGRPQFIFNKDSEKVPFKDLKYKTYPERIKQNDGSFKEEPRIVVYDTVLESIVGLADRRAFRRQMTDIAQANKERFEKLTGRFVLISEYAGQPIFTELSTTQFTEEQFDSFLDQLQGDANEVLAKAQKAEKAGETLDLTGDEIRDDYMGEEVYTAVTVQKTGKKAPTSAEKEYDIAPISQFRVFVNYGYTTDGRFKIEFKSKELGLRRLVFSFGEMAKMFSNKELFFEIVNAKIREDNKGIDLRAKQRYEEGDAEQERIVKGARKAQTMKLPELSVENFYNNVNPDLGNNGLDNLKSNVTSSLMVKPPKIHIKNVPVEGLGADVQSALANSKDNGEKPTPVEDTSTVETDDQNLELEERIQLASEKITALENQLNSLAQALGLDAKLSPDYTAVELELSNAQAELKQLQDQAGYSILSTYTEENEQQLEDFLGWVRAVLPDVITVEVTDKIEQRLRTEGLTVGKFVMQSQSAVANIQELKGIVSILPNSPSKYHEAFHGVFRMLLTDADIKNALKAGERELRASLRENGRTLNDEMNRYRQLSDFYANMSPAQLKDRVVEEYLADKFEEFKKNPKGTKTASVNKSIFRKIIDFLINLFTDYPTQQLTTLEELFEAIDSGKYKTAGVQSNVFTRATTSLKEVSAYSILPTGTKEYKEIVKGKEYTKRVETYLNAEDNVRLLNGITAEVYNRLKALTDSNAQNESVSDIIDDVVKKYHALYNPSREEYYNTPEKKQRAANLQNALVKASEIVESVDEEGNVTRKRVYPLIAEYVEEAIQMYDAVAEIDEDVVDEVGGAVQFFENSETIDPLKGLPTIVRALIGTTTVQATDAFGNAYFLDENGVPDETQKIFIPASMQTVYNGLIRVVADSNSEQEIFERLLNYRNTTSGKTSHEEINMFIDELFKKFNILKVEETEAGIEQSISLDNVKNSQLYQAFVKAFNKSKREYLFYSVDVANSEVRVFTSNRNGEAASQYDTWKEAWEYKFSEIRDDVAKRKELADVLDDLSTFVNVTIDPESFEADSEDLLNLLERLENLSGIELSYDFVKYSYYANMLQAEKIGLDEVPQSISFLYDRLNIPYLKAQIGKDQKSDFSILSSIITKDAGRGLFMRDYAFQAESEDVESQEENKKESTQTAGGRLKTIASGNVFFNSNIDLSTFTNAEGNNIQTYQQSTVLVRKVNGLNDAVTLEELLNDPYLKDHWLLQSEYFRNLSENKLLGTQSIDGMKSANHKVSKNYGSNQRAGHVYADFTDREFLLAMLSNYAKRNVEYEDFATAPVFIRVLEASRSGMTVNLPVIKTVNFEANPLSAVNKGGFSFTKEFDEIIISELLRDLDRIQRVAKERSDSGSLNQVADYADYIYNYNVIKDSDINKWIAEQQDQNPDKVFTKEEAVQALEKNLRGLRINNDFRMMLVDGYISKGLSEEAAEKKVEDLEMSARTMTEMSQSLRDELSEALQLGLYQHFTEFQEKLVEEGFLYKHKGGYTFDTQSVNKKSRNPLIGVLGANALSYMPQNIAAKLNLQQDYVQGENKDMKNVELDQRKLESNLAQIFFNNFINARAINQVNTGDAAALFKDPIDMVKRAKGQNASGITTSHSITDPSKSIYHSFDKVGDLQHIMFESDEFAGKYSGEGQERDDGQLYMTVKGLRHILFGMGRLSNAAVKLLDKLEQGESVSLDSVFGGNGQRGTIQFNAQTNSLKLVYFDGKTYLKMSAFLLTKEFTRREAIKNELQKGNEVDAVKEDSFLDKLRVVMEAREQATGTVVLASPESASKTYKPNILPRDLIQEVEYDNPLDQLEDRDFSNLDPNYLMLSTETPSNKTEITDPTQMMNLILAEISPEQANEKVFINGEETTLGELKNEYLTNGAEILKNKYFKVRDEFFDLEDLKNQIRLSRDLNKVTVKLDEFRKYAVKTLTEIGASQQEIDIFEDPDIDLNNAVTYNRFQNLVLSKFSKGVFKQKTKGYKLTLLSDSGLSVIRRKNTKDLKTGVSVDTVVPFEQYLRETQGMSLAQKQELYYRDDLQYNVEVRNSKGEVIERYSEMMMPQHSRDQKLGQSLFAVRIPSQDKHSAISSRVVDFMPAHYGSVAVFPKELLELSGADFDIDSVFVHAPETFVNQSGDVIEYGNPNMSDKDQMYAYFSYLYRTNDKFKELYPATLEDIGGSRLRSINMQVSAEIAKTLGLPHNITEYKKAVANNKGVDLIPYTQYNRLLEIKRAILGSDYLNAPFEGNTFGRAQEPANLKPFKDFETWIQNQEGLEAWLRELDRKGRVTDSMLGQVEAFTDIQEGAEGIGPAVNMAVDFSIINTFGLSTKEHIYYNGMPVSDFVTSVNSEQRRKMNLLSAVITGMTDNAKEQLAKKYGLNIEAVGQLGYLLAGGMPFNDAILFFNQPVVKEIYKQSKNTKSTVKFTKDLNQKEAWKTINDAIVKRLQDLKGQEESEAGAFTEDEELESKETTRSLTQEDLINGLEYGSKNFYQLLEKMSIDQLEGQLKVLDFSVEVQDATVAFTDFAKLTKLSRGTGKTVADFDNYVTIALDLIDGKYDKIPGVPKLSSLIDSSNGHKVLTAQVSVLLEMNALFPKLFITRSEVLNDLKKTTLGALAPRGFMIGEFNKGFVKDLVGIAMTKAYKNYALNNGSVNTRNLSNDLIYQSLKEKSGSNDIVTIVRSLREHLDGAGTPSKFLNDFLRSTGVTNLDGSVNARNRDKMNKIGINSFTKLSPQAMHIFESEFVELFTNTDVIEEGPLAGTTVRGAITDLMHYLLVKDGLSFRSGTFLQYIPKVALKDVIKHMGSVVDAFKDISSAKADLVKVFGQNHLAFVQEFLENWPLHASSFGYTNKIFKANYSKKTELRDLRDQMFAADEEKGTLHFKFWGGTTKETSADPAKFKEYLNKANAIADTLGFKQVDVTDPDTNGGLNPSNKKDRAEIASEGLKESKTAFPMYVVHEGSMYKLVAFKPGQIKTSKTNLNYFGGSIVVDLKAPRNKGTEAQILEKSKDYVVNHSQYGTNVPTFFGSEAVYEKVQIVGETSQYGGGYVNGPLPKYIDRSVKKKKVKGSANKNSSAQTEESNTEISEQEFASLEDMYGTFDVESKESSKSAADEESSMVMQLLGEAQLSDDIAGMQALDGDALNALLRKGVAKTEGPSEAEVKKAFKDVKNYKDADGTNLSLDSFTEAVQQAGNVKDAVDNIKNCYRK